MNLKDYTKSEVWVLKEGETEHTPAKNINDTDTKDMDEQEAFFLQNQRMLDLDRAHSFVNRKRSEIQYPGPGPGSGSKNGSFKKVEKVQNNPMDSRKFSITSFLSNIAKGKDDPGKLVSDSSKTQLQDQASNYNDDWGTNPAFIKPHVQK